MTNNLTGNNSQFTIISQFTFFRPAAEQWHLINEKLMLNGKCKMMNPLKGVVL
ncbi:hypothetical protein BH10PAT3_BH10PAT3_4890 [soil metagenome]